MRLLIFFSLFFYNQFINAQKITTTEIHEPVDFVNPLMGSDSKPDLSNGNTYPAIALPWGMNFWTPQTGKMGDGWIYTYSADKIRGFKQTHAPSPWMNDYGQFSIMPVTGKPVFNEDERSSWFSHKSETVKPYYYSVYLADYDVTTEITPTERAAFFKFTFPQNDKSYIVVDAFNKGSYIKIIPEENKIIGYSTKNSRGVPSNFKNYFVIQFDVPFEEINTFSDKTLKKEQEVTADHTGAVIGFKTKKGQIVTAKVASSFISFEQAELNLKEIGSNSFETVKEKGREAWNKKLGRIITEGGTKEQNQVFYSCLYRTMLFPRKFFEYDKNGNIVHYSPYNGEVLPGYMFTDTGFWDTFRALFPLLNILEPELNSNIQEGLLNAYQESGWLPEWGSPGLRNVMVGNNSASVVSEAYLKNKEKYKYDIEALYQALIHGANNEGPLNAVGRLGVNYYNKLGYVPYDVSINESAARTLEYAYDDFSIYQLGKALGKPKKEIDLYKKRSLNYKKLFDPETKLMRGKLADGKFMSPFNPFKWGDAFTEGNSWHYTWSVFHDVDGLINLMGGKAKFAAKLDEVFSLEPIFDEAYYKEVIHEIREMQIANMGQYAHGNQPIQHMIYLYPYAVQPWKTQYWVRETMNRMYKPTPDGYCGDEDNGQTSAWYVFSALGFYPVCPTCSEYVIGAPLFKKVTISLENGKQLIINAPKNSDQNKYIEKASLNGVEYNKSFFSHQDLMNGAVIDFEMNNIENKNGKPKTAPFSLSKEK
ncbi:GH92 family glycosyl hydrolase [Flavobacterium fluviale]|uniref:Glycoside hydrolase family 92 protein n=1 Tax=Flavobacterium fluviale TaxID=2249356 RepID=A0A344LT42_9FLAO|nr:GH92 family glycosyl hydrolase [Flavobacterium fluviale]AXB57084.1 glycoside hydrolase family 92 protein [Flavobacterium fluviale]